MPVPVLVPMPVPISVPVPDLKSFMPIWVGLRHCSALRHLGTEGLGGVAEA